MKFFDALVHSAVRPDADFRNLVYFDVERVLTCANAPQRFETALQLEQYWEHLIENETERLTQLGLTPHVAVGMSPAAEPTRAHYEIWRRLPELLRHDAVVALGELGLVSGQDREWALIVRQLNILRDSGAGKAVIFRLPSSHDTRLRRSWIQRLGTVADTASVPRSDILIHNAGWLTADTCEAEGFHIGLEHGPFGLSLADAVRVIKHHDPRHLIVSSGMRAGAANVVAFPKLAVALADAGLPSGDIERVLYGNAMALFIR